jgi:cytoskeletal protein RodZ
MARIGHRLQEVRLRKGLTLERISDETNISLKFLSGIENDNFAGFPGELYIVGFIRNYADYLGLDPDEFQRLYRSVEPEPEPQAEIPIQVTSPPITMEAPKTTARKKKRATGVSQTAPASNSSHLAADQQHVAIEKKEEIEKAPEHFMGSESFELPKPAIQPLPIAEISERNGELGKPQVRRSILLIVSLFLLVGIVYIGVKLIDSGSSETSAAKGATEYRVDGTPFEKRVYPGDSLLVPSGDNVYKIKLISITETANFQTPFGTINLQVGDQKPINPDSSTGNVIDLMASDFSKGNAVSGVLIKLDIQSNTVSTTTDNQVAAGNSQSATQTGQTQTNLPSSSAPPIVLLRSPKGTYPFTALVSFRGPCMFRYEADRREWVERYYSRGESLTVNADSMLTIWTSNAQAVKVTLQISGGRTADLELGGPGEIAVKKISWMTDGGTWVLAASTID